MKINGKITFLIDSEITRIQLHDVDSSITFLEIELTPEQLSSALSRLAHTKCETVEIQGIDKIGKIMIHETFTFKVPDELSNDRDKYKLEKYAQTLLNKDNRYDGFEVYDLFSSQNTFYYDNNKELNARCTIRKWVDKK